jgi:deoxyribodipyrimidine photo-lyase
MTRLVWFRNDLRVTDHPALAGYADGADYAWDHTSRLLPVFIFPSRLFSTTSFGFPKVGPHRAQFLIETVADLKRELQQRGSDLIVAQGSPARVLVALTRQFGVAEIWYQDEGGTEESAEVAELEAEIARLGKLGGGGGTGGAQDGGPQAGGTGPGSPEPGSGTAGAPDANGGGDDPVATVAGTGHSGVRGESRPRLCPYHGQTLYHPEDLPFATEDMPLMYTDFRNTVEARAVPRPATAAPENLPPLPGSRDAINQMLREYVGADGTSMSAPLRVGPPTVEALSGSSAPPADPRGAIQFAGGESAAWQRLNAYFWDRDRLRRYKKTRNGLLGADYSSKLSPWLANGSISARNVVAEIRRYEVERVKNRSTYWLVFELIWRDYFAFLLRKFGSAMFRFEGPMNRHYRWTDNWKRFTAWREGTTGQGFIDANMRELAATGYMSNRGRQNVASYLSRDLKVNWLMGAEYFESQLVDYDPASNYGNWSYTVGVGTDPRRDRYFNQEVQAAKYDPEARYRLHWLRGAK